MLIPAISVDNVSMMFNLSRQREQRLKEYLVNLVKGRLEFDEFWALRNVSFKLTRGQSLGIIGVNGSGKSTLLKIISQIIKPTSGVARAFGSIAPLIEMGGGFDRDLTARENIFLVGAMHGHSRKFIRNKFDDIVDFAEISEFIDVPLRNFSSGMVARLGFSIATLVNADILIADEVLSVGDIKFRMKCEARINEMTNDGATVLLVSHSMEQVKKVCEQALWLEKGKARMLGEASIVCEEYKQSLLNER